MVAHDLLNEVVIWANIPQYKTVNVLGWTSSNEILIYRKRASYTNSLCIIHDLVIEMNYNINSQVRYYVHIAQTFTYSH